MPEELVVMVDDASARASAVAEAYLKSSGVKKVILPAKNQLAKEFLERRYGKEVVLEDFNIKEPKEALAVARKHRPGLVDVCQDDALALGTVDSLQDNGFPNTFGPRADAARIESSKIWSRRFQKRHGIPHPNYQAFSSLIDAVNHAKEVYGRDSGSLKFWKADGLCEGKGAIPSTSLDEAIAAINAINDFGEAGSRLLCEDWILGQNGQRGVEASIYTFTDGTHTHTLRASQDNKRQLDFDEGPNTGGMGVVLPTSAVNPDLSRVIERAITQKAIDGLREDGTPYVGVLYTGIMLVSCGLVGAFPYVVEFNARWGAPEAEVEVPGIRTPMDEIVMACMHGNLDQVVIEEDDKARVCIVGASRGYPDPDAVKAVKGKEIFGLRDADEVEGATIHGAGVKVVDGRHYANGGRLFSVVGEAESVREARAIASYAMGLIHVEGNNLQHRDDIGSREVEREYRRDIADKAL